MTPRKPRFGDYYVFHDDPRDVAQVDAVMDGVVRYHSRVTGDNHERTLESFNEFFTRIPI